jgi:serine protease Do
MIRKSFALFLLGAASAIGAYSQQTLNPPPKDDTPKVFSWSFDSDGGYLGVQTQEVTRDNFAKFGLREVRGVAVEKVMERSPAEAAGIRSGDVIVNFNGEEITSARKLTRLINEVDPDHQATVTVLRQGREQNMTVMVGKRPMPEFNKGNFQFDMPMGKFEMPDLKELPQMKDLPDLKDLPKGGFRTFEVPNGKGFVWTSGGRQIGVGIVPLSKQLADYFRVDGGALIDEVRENSPAAKAGLRAGDIIVEADGKPIRGQMDLIKAISEKKEGDVQLTVVRSGSRQTFTVTPEAGSDGNFFFRSDDGQGILAPQVPKQLSQPIAPISPAKLLELYIKRSVL